MKSWICIFGIVALAAGLPAQDKKGASKDLFQGLGDFPGGTFESLAQRVSADGSVVVGYGTTASGKQAFRWTQSEGMVSLGNLPDGSFKQSWAAGVSADGSVIVGYGDPDGSGWNSHKGFRWTQSAGMADMGGLNGSTRYEASGVSADGSVVVGDGGQQAFRWTQARGMQGLGYLPGGSVSFPNAVSPEGSVIAGTAASTSGYAAFRWTRSTGMVSLGHLPGRRTTHPGGVSANGSIIVGGSYVDRAHATAFIWDAAHGMRDLRSVLETECGLDLAGWNLQNALDVTPDGSVIVGWGANPSGRQEAFRAVLRGHGGA